jgi:tRNA/tmRNA/rRNA uracil-C5-methylase (TrmA/RlmC/RlmD family)
MQLRLPNRGPRRPSSPLRSAVARRPPNDFPFPYRYELEAEIDTLTNLGAGVARVPVGEPPQPWVVFVPFALPGERVRVRVWRNRANYSEADLLEVLRPSPHRVAPRCPLFGNCGGCQYQNLEYTEQLRWKRRHVVDLLARLARIEAPVADPIPSPRIYGYRSKLTPHFERPPAEENADAGTWPIGFLRAGARRALVDVPQCPLATPAINARLATFRAEIRAQRASYTRGATLLLREAGGVVVTDPTAEIMEEVDGIQLRFLARDFFQNNPFLLPAFVRHVREQARSGGARYLVDAYCGSGLFALTAAAAFTAVAGVELSESAVARATANAAANGLGHVRFLAADAAAIFAGLEFPAAETAVVIDPPRKGCDPAFLDQLIAYAPRTLVYVSCDPATQMRDLARLVPAGYRVQRVQPFDLFPQTRHLECVATLQLEPAAARALSTLPSAPLPP